MYASSDQEGVWLAVSLLVILALLLAGPAMLAFQRIDLGASWSHADRSSAGLAPSPQARRRPWWSMGPCLRWRAPSAHTWIATKAADATHYRVHQVLGWRRPTVSSRPDQPDRAWYGSAPTLIAQVSGTAAGRAIPAIRDPWRHILNPSAIASGGANSNTFVARVVRRVPELQVDFPPTAVGKDYLLDGWWARAPSGTGYQVSLGGGLFGLTVAYDEGVEWQLMGLTLGVDIARPALKLPGVGRLGMAALDAEGDH